jgi:hypothetical protein
MRVGVGIEAGDAHALGKLIIVIAQTGSGISATLQDNAEQLLLYEEINEVLSLLILTLIDTFQVQLIKGVL